MHPPYSLSDTHYHLLIHTRCYSHPRPHPHPPFFFFSFSLFFSLSDTHYNFLFFFSPSDTHYHLLIHTYTHTLTHTHTHTHTVTHILSPLISSFTSHSLSDTHHHLLFRPWGRVQRTPEDFSFLCIRLLLPCPCRRNSSRYLNFIFIFISVRFVTNECSIYLTLKFYSHLYIFFSLLFTFSTPYFYFFPCFYLFNIFCFLFLFFLVISYFAFFFTIFPGDIRIILSSPTNSKYLIESYSAQNLEINMKKEEIIIFISKLSVTGNRLLEKRFIGMNYILLFHSTTYILCIFCILHDKLCFCAIKITVD